MVCEDTNHGNNALKLKQVVRHLFVIYDVNPLLAQGVNDTIHIRGLCLRRPLTCLWLLARENTNHRSKSILKFE